MIVIPVILLVLAVALAVVAGLAWTRNLPGNDWIGIRAPEARKSKENWDLTHRIAGPPWAVSALAMFGAAALGFLAARPGTSGWLWLWTVVAVLLSLGFIGVGAAMGANAIAAWDVRRKVLEEQAGGGCCSSGGAAEPAHDHSAGDCGGDCSTCTSCDSHDDAPAAPSTPAAPSGPGVDRDALRRAAERADRG
ncbi:SdpI family protein [Corynebacterium sp. 335C]